MDAKYFIRLLRTYCTNIYTHCGHCPFNTWNNIADNGLGMNCHRYIINNPALAEQRITEIYPSGVVDRVEEHNSDIGFVEYVDMCLDICHQHRSKNNTCDGCILLDDFCRILYSDGIDILKRAGRIPKSININCDELLDFLNT